MRTLVRLAVAAFVAGTGAASAETPDRSVPDPAAATDAFRATYREQCHSAFDGAMFDGQKPEVHRLEWTPDYEGAEPQSYTLYGFNCDLGAYNVSSVWMLGTRYDGIVPLAFAHPRASYEYEDEEETRLRSHTLQGIEASLRLVNAEFDPASATMTARSAWRGLGDASAVGTWRFEGEGFSLVRYEVDPTYDGEIGPMVTLFGE